MRVIFWYWVPITLSLGCCLGVVVTSLLVAGRGK